MRRSEVVLSRALEEVFDGPLVRKLLARRADLRRKQLEDPTGAAVDLKRLHDLSPSDSAVTDQLLGLYTELKDYKGMVQLYEDMILRGKDPASRAEPASKVARPDGSDWQTGVSNVRNQRGLLVDPVRRKLLWVGADTWLRQELILSSSLDGSGVEMVYAAPEGAQIRELALNPYSQKLYWLDPTIGGGSLLWADADGNRVATLATGLGSVARGLIVRPFEDALYYVSDVSLTRARLDGSNAENLADLSQRAYTGLMLPVNAVSFSPTYIFRPAGNLAFVIAAPFGAPPCVLNDSFEPNNSAAAARAITVGSANGALCTTDAALPQDIDYFKITVPDGKQLDLNLGNLPADYGLYVQRAGLTLATSLNPGLANETIALPNYDGDGEYIIVVFTSAPVNNPSPYTLAVGLSDAPPSTNLSLIHI